MNAARTSSVGIFDFLELMRAKTLAVAPQHLAQATAVYAELLRDHPRKSCCLPEYARLSAEDGVLQESLKTLSTATHPLPARCVTATGPTVLTTPERLLQSRAHDQHAPPRYDTGPKSRS